MAVCTLLSGQPDKAILCMAQDFDLYDSGLWHLTLSVSNKGLQAYLKNIADATVPVRFPADVVWKDTEEEQLLSQIESAVFDNPMVLDDYSARILVTTPRYVIMPADAVEEDDDARTLFCHIYRHIPEREVLVYREGHLLYAFHLVDGLRSFLSRTFAGARIMPHMAALVNGFLRKGNDDLTIFADLRHEVVDIVITEGPDLIIAATHEARNAAEAAYHIINCMEVAGKKMKGAAVSLSGTTDYRTELMGYLRRGGALAMTTPLPRLDIPDKTSTAVRLSIHSIPRTACE